MKKALKEILQLERQYLIPSYARADIAFVKGEGTRLVDTEGRRYLDFFSGIAVTSLGHCHPALVKALTNQAKTLWHTSNLYAVAPQAALAKRLSDLTNRGKVFFCNSGTEANEAAIKLARLHGKSIGQNRHTILTLENSFHGRTLASLTATGQKKYREGFEPLVPGFKYVKPNDPKDLEYKADDSVCAVMVEFVQGEGGVQPLEPAFVRKIFELAKARGFLVIADEVQTGLCRTGRWFAYQHYGVTPDIVTLAKALGNGFPVGAMVAKRGLADLFSAGRHASTFGGNFLACAVADAVLQVMSEQHLDREADRKGRILEESLLRLRRKHPDLILDVRGLGLMRGLRIREDRPVADIVAACRGRGLLCGSAGQNVLRLLPPLIVSSDEIREAVDILDRVFTDLVAEEKPLLGRMLSKSEAKARRKTSRR